MAERAAAEAFTSHREVPPPVTHPPMAPGEREVFPPTKVGGTPNSPWHDQEGRPPPPASVSKSPRFEFVAQINLTQLRDCAFITPGLLPSSGVLYFFIESGNEGDDILSQVMHYDPAPDAPPWPAPLPHGTVDPEQRELLNATFGNMRSSFECYRSSTPAPALDALTLPPYPKHQLMSDAWERWEGGESLSENSDHDERSESDWSEFDRCDIESKYIWDARELGPPCSAPMMLGHRVIPGDVANAWMEVSGSIADSPAGRKIDAGQVCLLQVTPHGPDGNFLAFFASERELRERRRDAVRVVVM